ncbi:hypothetical protein GGU10DRAFT_364733 [Lentinula aff. detonsa]|uniref:Uncharacterized protein n=1 Tax=Lentinula aff. detonsa TaxID=2804958 RepID=A0AA38KXI0_9AGAR|nr:hypothetical protein GGU10DRAFT_364733 [Lentinula aff. detonsa]
MTSISTSIQRLLGRKPSSQLIDDYLNELSSAGKPSSLTPEIKSYSDVVYYNFHALGLSLLFKPIDGYKPRTGLVRSELMEDKLVLDSLDIYNIPASRSDSKGSQKKREEIAFATYPMSPVILNLTDPEEEEGKNIPHSLQISKESTGKDFVQGLGEPDRKGGGSGPSSGSIGIWCEWTKHGILVEFGGVEAIGPQAWERGKDAVWKVVTVFLPNTSAT